MPDLARMESLELRWIALILGRNLAMMVLYVGAWHLYLYTFKGQGTNFGYSARPFATSSSRFLSASRSRQHVLDPRRCRADLDGLRGGEAVVPCQRLLPFIDWETNPCGS